VKHEIELTFNYRNHLDEVSRGRHVFNSIPEFKQYLRWEPVKAMLIGYGPIKEELLIDARVSDVKLAILHDGARVEFENAHKFADYLKRHKEVAKALQFSMNP
jgi:hypothetical protein